jgi:hypothetical protein
LRPCGKYEPTVHPEPAPDDPAANGGEPPAAGPPVRTRRHPWRRRILLGLGGLIAAAAVILGILAGTYQPLQFGEEAGLRFTGLPTATGVKFVNTFGRSPGDWYFPPQAGAFTVVLSLANRGTQPVTIEAVSMASPDQQAEQAQGVALWPFTPVGRPLWLPVT